MRIFPAVKTLRMRALPCGAVLAAGLLGAGPSFAADLFVDSNQTYTIDAVTNTDPQIYRLVVVAWQTDGTLNILDGRLLQSSAVSDIALGESFFQPDGIVNVIGRGSRWESAELISIGRCVGGCSYAEGRLNIQSGGSVRTRDLTLSGGAVSRQHGIAMVTGAGSTLEVEQSLAFGSGLPGELSVESGARVFVGATVSGSGTLRLEGGTLSLANPGSLAPGILVYTAGTLEFRSDQTLDGGAGLYTDLYGSPPMLPAGKGLTIDGMATLSTALLVDGGAFSARAVTLQPGGSLTLPAGEVTLAGDGIVLRSHTDFGTPPAPLVVGDGGPSPARLYVTGTGDVFLGATTVSADGGLDFAGRSLALGSLDNAGRVGITGATLDTGTGLLNTGTLVLVDTAVNGAVTSPAGSAINVVGTVTFNGPYSGAGRFFGSGTAVFNGGTSPGDSPDVVSVEGSVVLGPSNTLTVELGSECPGAFDRLEIRGKLRAGGRLAVERLVRFNDEEGVTYEIIRAAEIEGQFDYEPLDLGHGRKLVLRQGDSAITLAVVSD